MFAYCDNNGLHVASLQLQSVVLFFFMFFLVSHLLSWHVSVSNWLPNPPSNRIDKSMLFFHPPNVWVNVSIPSEVGCSDKIMKVMLKHLSMRQEVVLRIRAIQPACVVAL